VKRPVERLGDLVPVVLEGVEGVGELTEVGEVVRLEQLARRALAIVEGGRRQRKSVIVQPGYSNKLRPAFPPTLSIHHSPTSTSSTVSPFENLAAAWRPLITMAVTVASANDFRNAHEGRVQFSIGRAPTRSQAIRSQPGWVMYWHVPGAGQCRSPAAKSRAHSLPARSISCQAERLGSFSAVDAVAGELPSFLVVVDPTAVGLTVSLSEERSASTPATKSSAATPPTTTEVNSVRLISR
jgi:hypothetical protein